jgi:SOS-response transcriptional repressor LexA
LIPENSKYQPITISEHDDFEIWGVVKNVIHQV